MGDPETSRQSSSVDVVELKLWLTDNPQAIGRICTRLAVERVEVLHGTDLKKRFAYSLIDEVGEAVIENYETIQKAVELPLSDWPEDAAISPGQISEEMDSIVAREQNG